MLVRIVVIPMIVARLSISTPTCPSVTPSVTNMRLNSLICATASPALKLVFLLKPFSPMSVMTISGFPMSTNRLRRIAGMISPARLASSK